MTTIPTIGEGPSSDADVFLFRGDWTLLRVDTTPLPPLSFLNSADIPNLARCELTSKELPMAGIKIEMLTGIATGDLAWRSLLLDRLQRFGVWTNQSAQFEYL